MISHLVDLTDGLSKGPRIKFTGPNEPVVWQDPTTDQNHPGAELVDIL